MQVFGLFITEKNTDQLSSVKVIPLLLNALKFFSDTENLLSIVLCIETLTESNGQYILKHRTQYWSHTCNLNVYIFIGSNQQQLLDNKGIPLLVSVMANNTEVWATNQLPLSSYQYCIAFL